MYFIVVVQQKSKLIEEKLLNLKNLETLITKESTQSLAKSELNCASRAKK